MCEKEDEKEPVESESNWQEDIEKLGYYYDDAAGYEVYQDDDDDERDEAKEQVGHVSIRRKEPRIDTDLHR